MVRKLNTDVVDAIRNYVTLGYTAITASLSWDAKSKKKGVGYTPCWQQATTDNCLNEFCNPSHNAVALVTGFSSDTIVIDVDHVKPDESDTHSDGGTVIAHNVDLHGQMDCPVATTGSGGQHYFFSYSKSLENGLVNKTNGAKVVVDGKPTTIDHRGDGGNVFVAPTAYLADGKTRRYVFDEPLPPSRDLPAMPTWLIGILNANQGRVGRSLAVKRSWDCPVVCTEDDCHFFKRVKGIVESEMNNEIASYYHRGPTTFDFDLVDKETPCVICIDNTHDSNKYRCQQIFGDCCSLGNFSSKCNQRIIVGDYTKNPYIAQILESPCVDNIYVDIWRTSKRYRGEDVVVTGDKRNFYIFDGYHWVLVDDTSVQKDLRLLAYYALDSLYKGLVSTIVRSNKHGIEVDKCVQSHLKQVGHGRSFVQKAGNIAAITTSAKQLLWDVNFASQLDVNPDLLGVPDGVVDLTTGEQRKGRQEDNVSRVIKVDYLGLEHPTTDIDNFFDSIFEDRDVVRYLQKLLGYGITGHVKEQKWLICHGVGSNGKGVLQKLLEAVMGDYYLQMSPDCIIKRGKAPGKNAPTPYIADLCGKRIAICDELPDDAVLDEELVKRATGDTTLSARYLNANPFEFKPTHLPILLTNQKPSLNIDDAAVLRRILFAPFALQFKHPWEMDPTDTTHRPLDANLGAKLTTPECLSQLLTWLVNGAVAWGEEGLGEPPAVMRSALDEYLRENDTLMMFIDEHCTRGRDLHVDTTAFKAAYERVSGKNISAKELVRKMEARKFTKVRAHSNVPGRPCRFKGLVLNE